MRNHVKILFFLIILIYLWYLFTLGAGIPNYRFSEIAISAGKIWQQMGNSKTSCSELIAQLRNYKLYETLYNTLYLENIDILLK